MWRQDTAGLKVPIMEVREFPERALESNLWVGRAMGDETMECGISVVKLAAHIAAVQGEAYGTEGLLTPFTLKRYSNIAPGKK